MAEYLISFENFLTVNQEKGSNDCFHDQKSYNFTLTCGLLLERLSFEESAINS